MATTDLTAVLERDEDGALPVGLTLLTGAIAAAVLSPLVWVVANALEADGALELVTAPTTVEVFINSGLLVAGVTFGSIIVGVPTAYLTVRTDLPFKRGFSVLLAMPLVIPSYIGAFAFVSAFGPRGTLQGLVAPYGVETLPSIYGLWGTVFVLTLYTYPYVFLTTRAALKSMDTTLVDAARTLGHGRREAFRRVTLPQIRPAVAAGALLVALYALSDFGTPSIMRYNVFTSVIYSVYGDVLGGGRNLAAMLSLQLVVVTTIILAIESRVRGAGVTAESPNTRTTPIQLGRWRWGAVGGCLLVVIAALAVPLAVLTSWLAQAGQPTTGRLAFELSYVTNSVSVAAAAAFISALAALPLAYFAARHDSRAASLFERASYVGYAVPGVVMGLALVYFGATYGGGLYRNGLILLPLLVFAYVVRFLPQAVGSSRTSVEQVSGQLPEAARTLGRTPAGAFRDVTLPLVAPGVAAGAALVFLTTMKELPATLMLRPAGFSTLVTRVWTAYESGYVGQAALPAFVLLFVSGLSMLLILRMEGYDVE